MMLCIVIFLIAFRIGGEQATFMLVSLAIKQSLEGQRRVVVKGMAVQV